MQRVLAINLVCIEPNFIRLPFQVYTRVFKQLHMLIAVCNFILRFYLSLILRISLSCIVLSQLFFLYV